MGSSRRLRLAVGSLMLLLLGVLVVLLVTMGNQPMVRGFVVHVDFDNVDAMKEGADVRISALTVGQVLAIRHGVTVGSGEPAAMARVRVDVWLRRDLAPLVTKGSVFYVNAKGVIGERYLEIAPPTEDAPTIRSGEAVRGVDFPQLDRLVHFSHSNLRAMTAVARQLAPDIKAMARATGHLRDTLKRDLPEHKVRSVIASLLTLAQAADVVQSDIDRATDGGRRLRRTLVSVQHTTRQTQAGLETLPRRLPFPDDLPLREWDTKLRAALEKLSGAMKRADRLRRQSRTLLTRVKSGRGTIGRILADPELVDEIKATHKILKQTPWRTLGKPRRRPRSR